MIWFRNLLPPIVAWLLLATAPFYAAATPTQQSVAAGTRAAAPSSPAALQATLRALLTGSQSELNQRYQQLGLVNGRAVQAFYAAQHYPTHWVRPGGWNPAATQALHLLGQAAEFGLDRSRYGWPHLPSLPDSLRRTTSRTDRQQQLALCELRLTDALLRYTYHLRHGVLQPHSLLPVAALDSLLAHTTALVLQRALQAPDFTRALLAEQPAHRGYQQLQAAWSRALHSSAPDSARLMNDTTAGFRQVAINLERYRWETAPDSAYAEVNIPAYRLQLMHGGRVLQTHRVVVGQPEWPTPVLSSRILVFVTAPEWRVPYSIAVREFLPELQRDPGYLYDHHYRLYDGRGRLINPWHVNWRRITPEKFTYAIRQRAGRTNALGSVVFYFPNQQKVFLHDTPARAAFSRPARALSHGCVRVEHPLKLAEYLLRREGRASDLRAMHTSIRNQSKQRFDLNTGLRVHLRYYTCEAENGTLRFYPDIYRHDAALGAALFNQSN
ncbi:L,D-transpeptidase family protein [Hymenobacter sublimis]|uniref:L,D-transpeptidase family protein n=1 Tax=Hymenobacter sublimis TaxID=2933777 RepID=A0ABY4JDM8_9BACT|nr:L,D-transpeptidase family protein [Hymenobacter sublimis]UPL50934.1 L,D-transpeptidase family protein [Hymenobacter sublimis]